MSIIKHHRNRMSGGGSRSASISDRVHRYALTAAGVTAAAVPGGVAMAGGVPPTSAASAGGWSWSNTVQNNQTGLAGGSGTVSAIWGAGGSLLSNNIKVGMRRFNNGVAGGTFRDAKLSQAGWNPGTHYVAFGGPALAGAVVNASSTGGGATNWTPPSPWALGFVGLARSTRAGGVANTTASWGTQPGHNPIMGKSARMYLTFQITDFGNTYYGWLDLQTQEDASKNLTLTIHGWAYSTGSIMVGASAIPGGTGLAALALGAAGLRGRRRSRVA